jgi:low affinity Fe/Cu permease
MDFSHLFTSFADRVAKLTGRPVTFLLCLLMIVVWAATGPVFHFSDTWQLVVNTGTTIITFLMVFLIQNSQNRDAAAIQAKLDELIRASAAHNRFIGIEELTDEELAGLRKREKDHPLVAANEAADDAEDQAQERADDAAREASAR